MNEQRKNVLQKYDGIRNDGKIHTVKMFKIPLNLALIWLAMFWQILFTVAVETKTESAMRTSVETLEITDRSFQIDFVNEVRSTLDHMAMEHLNRFLQQLKPNTKNAIYAEALEEATKANSLEPKILFIKQFLDVENLDDDNTTELESIALRNVNFLAKLDKQLHRLQETSIMELRQFRMYQLCKQFREKSGGVRLTTFKPPYSIRQTKLVPLDESNIDEALRRVNRTRQTISLDLNEFGRALYGRVNLSGAEIIDDYLTSLRKLLQEVIGEKHAHEQETSKLSKLLQEIDNILAASDFYEKRQKLYEYLEQNLAADYEQFKSSEHAQEDLAEILTKLRERGLDLFVTFLFSNFEFLERLHKELAQLLPTVTDATQHDEVTRLLYAVHTSYNEFKRDSENNDKYEAYLEPVKALYARTSNLGNDGHIFELLHNASLNVGSVTLNMIRAKCDEV